jgi:hypothetical protein
MSAPRELRSIGLNIFITHFETFSQLRDRKSIARFCVDNGISNESGAGIRASYMEKVLKDKNLLRECLTYIRERGRNSTQTKKAAQIIDQLDA